MKRTNRLSAKQMCDICSAHKYVLFQHLDGNHYAVNGAYMIHRYVLKKYSPRMLTPVVGYRPISFSEYISHKLPFEPCKPKTDHFKSYALPSW